jgi:hypothetical protein
MLESDHKEKLEEAFGPAPSLEVVQNLLTHFRRSGDGAPNVSDLVAALEVRERGSMEASKFQNNAAAGPSPDPPPLALEYLLHNRTFSSSHVTSKMLQAFMAAFCVNHAKLGVVSAFDYSLRHVLRMSALARELLINLYKNRKPDIAFPALLFSAGWFVHDAEVMKSVDFCPALVNVLSHHTSRWCILAAIFCAFVASRDSATLEKLLSAGLLPALMPLVGKYSGHPQCRDYMPALWNLYKTAVFEGGEDDFPDLKMNDAPAMAWKLLIDFVLKHPKTVENICIKASATSAAFLLQAFQRCSGAALMAVARLIVALAAQNQADAGRTEFVGHLKSRGFLGCVAEKLADPVGEDCKAVMVAAEACACFPKHSISPIVTALLHIIRHFPSSGGSAIQVLTDLFRSYEASELGLIQKVISDYNFRVNDILRVMILVSDTVQHCAAAVNLLDFLFSQWFIMKPTVDVDLVNLIEELIAAGYCTQPADKVGFLNKLGNFIHVARSTTSGADMKPLEWFLWRMLELYLSRTPADTVAPGLNEEFLRNIDSAICDASTPVLQASALSVAVRLLTNADAREKMQAMRLWPDRMGGFVQSSEPSVALLIMHTVVGMAFLEDHDNTDALKELVGAGVIRDLREKVPSMNLSDATKLQYQEQLSDFESHFQ